MMIITLTLNPAFDVHVSLPTFTAGREHHAQSVTRSVGGKGVNISRALTENGIKNHALLLLGEENAKEFANELDCTGVSFVGIPCKGRIRENITIHPKEGKETRLSFAGFFCDKQVLQELKQKIPSNAIVTFSGSLPQGITEEDAKAFLLCLKEKGVRLVLDSKSLSFKTICTIQPWLMKPNAEEMEHYCNVTTPEALEQTALALHQDGIEHVLVSLGEQGAILASNGQLFRGNAPNIPVLSTIGAGDSMIAGFLATDGAPDKRLKVAIAYGSAACLREGTAPPLKKDIDALLPQIHIH